MYDIPINLFFVQYRTSLFEAFLIVVIIVIIVCNDNNDLMLTDFLASFLYSLYFTCYQYRQLETRNPTDEIKQLAKRGKYKVSMRVRPQ